ncbi:MAG: hypothetical protein K8S97_16335 [Anaerolineae bacterium]|nr:hypothetical protein [Anaerolineae bacterium]
MPFEVWPDAYDPYPIVPISDELLALIAQDAQAALATLEQLPQAPIQQPVPSAPPIAPEAQPVEPEPLPTSPEPQALPDIEARPGELRAFGAFMYDVYADAVIGEDVTDHDSAVMAASMQAIMNEPEIVSAVVGASSPQAAMGILFALAEDELPVGIEMSILASALSSTKPEEFLGYAQSLVVLEATTGGNRAAELLYQMTTVGEGQLAVDILAEAAKEIGGWEPAEGFPVSFVNDLSDVVPDATTGTRGITLIPNPGMEYPRLFGLPPHSDVSSWVADRAVSGSMGIYVSPQTFLNIAGDAPHTATGDLLAIYIEEVIHSHQYNLYEHAGDSAGTIIRVINRAVQDAYGNAWEYEAKRYILSLADAGNLHISGEQREHLVNTMRPGNYANISGATGFPDIYSFPNDWMPGYWVEDWKAEQEHPPY